MILLEATEDFTLKDFNKISQLKRKTELTEDEPENIIHSGDKFVADKNMSKYLLGNNDSKIIVAKVLEVLPEKTKKTTKKKGTK